MKLVTREFTVPAADSDVSVYVRNKHPADMTQFTPARTVLFVHGATYPAETVFDLCLDGFSWMEYMASSGFDVYLMDVRGYGRSTRPPQMHVPAEANPPFAHTADARADLAGVVKHICQNRALDRICLIGWSWGSAIMASYAAENQDKVKKLVLISPGWLRNGASAADPGGPLGAWRSVTREKARDRWLDGIPTDKRDFLVPPGWFEVWADAVFATDHVGAGMSPPVLRVPNGVIEDGRVYWTAGRPIYDPAAITAPTMLVVGEWDRDTPPSMAQELFRQLVNVRQKHLLVLGEATHMALIEANRPILIEHVQLFLEKGPFR
jgi:pimeloyl-ACP methyl ester carboxylesterase